MCGSESYAGFLLHLDSMKLHDLLVAIHLRRVVGMVKIYFWFLSEFLE